MWFCEEPRSRQKKRVYLRKRDAGVYVHTNTHVCTHAPARGHLCLGVGLMLSPFLPHYVKPSD